MEKTKEPEIWTNTEVMAMLKLEDSKWIELRYWLTKQEKKYKDGLIPIRGVICKMAKIQNAYQKED